MAQHVPLWVSKVTSEKRSSIRLPKVHASFKAKSYYPYTPLLHDVRRCMWWFGARHTVVKRAWYHLYLHPLPPRGDRDVSYLAMLTAKVEGRILDTGVGFSPTECSTKHKGNRSRPAQENGAHVGASVWPRTPLIKCRGGEIAP